MLTFVVNMLVFLSSVMPFGSFEFTAENVRNYMKEAMETVSSFFDDFGCRQAANDRSDSMTR